MNGLTIRQKLNLIFVALILVFVSVSVYSAYALNKINEGAMRIATTHLLSVLVANDNGKAMEQYRQLEYSIVTAPNLISRSYAEKKAVKLADQIDITFDTLEKSLQGNLDSNLTSLRQKWSAYRSQLNNIVDMSNNNQSAQAALILDNSLNQFEELDNLLVKVIDARKDFIHAETVAAEAEYDRTKFILIASVLVVILISVTMAFYLSRSINTSIRYLIEIAENIAQGNLTADVTPKTKDEFGMLTKAFAETVTQLKGLIKGITSTAENLVTFSDQLTSNADQSAQATQQVANSISNVAFNMTNQGEQVNSSVREINDMTNDIAAFEKLSEQSSKAAHDVADIAQNGRTAVSEAISQMETIAESVTESAEVIRQLAARSEEISNISDTISGIAEQTNLLALNAAIEAARAGEHGRGFAVVADEVRKLAEGSALAAAQIADLIRVIQSDTTKAVERMEQGTLDVQSGKSVVDKAGNSFGTIVKAVIGLTENAEIILRAARSSAEKINKLVAVMDELNKTSAAVSQEAESVSAATQQLSASMDEIAGASKNMSDMAQKLQDSTAMFKL
ncbi:MAG: MCP four helix bundle domain-containing protein [Selenomonadaceae bacterium]|nr:MCP four helix bundle domain-containing protein [Selenomonadaceae bacterium]